MTPDTTRPPLQLLRDSLMADSPLRERAVARLMAICMGAAIPFIFLLGLSQGFELPLAINAVLVLLVAYYLLLLRKMETGWYRRGVAWVNVFIEVSLPFFILLLTALMRGPEYTLMTPTHVIWGALVVSSAMRATPKLSMAAGVVATVEWLVVYFGLLFPHIPADAPTGMLIPAAVLRGVILLMTGLFGAMLARHFVRKTEEALSAVREQDLMGKYFLHERLGAGGMAEVYRATYCPEGGFQKPVAIKRVLPKYAQNQVFSEMFREEARLCAMLTHPNIIQVFDCGRFRDSFILAMEYVDGLALNRLLRRRHEPLPIAAVTYLAAELASAVDYIHRKVDTRGEPLNLVHRDINPPNVLVSRIGEVKLGDFGVSNAATRVEGVKEDLFYGKMHYAAPEQMVTGPYDGRADLFALGLTLHEALTGRRVYTKEVDDQLRRGAFPRIASPSSTRKDIPLEVDRIVMGLLELDVERRTPTAAALREQLVTLGGVATPYPQGQVELAKAIEEALGTGGAMAQKIAKLPERLTEAFRSGRLPPSGRGGSASAPTPSGQGPRAGSGDAAEKGAPDATRPQRKQEGSGRRPRSAPAALGTASKTVKDLPAIGAVPSTRTRPMRAQRQELADADRLAPPVPDEDEDDEATQIEER